MATILTAVPDPPAPAPIANANAFEAMAKDPASGLVSYQRYLGGGIWVDVPCSSTLPDDGDDFPEGPDPPAPAPD